MFFDNYFEAQRMQKLFEFSQVAVFFPGMGINMVFIPLITVSAMLGLAMIFFLLFLATLATRHFLASGQISLVFGSF